MTPTRFKFAPVSGSPSTAVRMASGWFIFNGAVSGLLVVIAILGVAAGWGDFREARVNWLSLLVSIATAIGLVWTGTLVWRCRRIGGVLALGFILLQVIATLLSPPVDRVVLILMGIGVLILISIWGELR